jgi:hypothetical protein
MEMLMKKINSKLLMFLINIFPCKFSYNVILKSLLEKYRIFNVNPKTRFYEEIPHKDIKIIGYKNHKLKFKFRDNKDKLILFYKKDYEPSKKLTACEKMSFNYLIWEKEQLKNKSK